MNAVIWSRWRTIQCRMITLRGTPPPKGCIISRGSSLTPGKIYLARIGPMEIEGRTLSRMPMTSDKRSKRARKNVTSQPRSGI
ncbi:UNVERIFIED_CONTAM: hypothetical protein Slati_2485400 [Sesamum latifolium]|uniref:Uncharacterized protein n=1 Tax=Sesamum latifolium TaxID=2727402 RepID=A0AAW2WG35_9LAMI